MDEIFISYKRDDQHVARLLAAALRNAGWSVWWDERLRAGDEFDDVIEDVIRSAKCVIVLWSIRSIRSKFVKDEATLALKLGTLVPVSLDSTDLPMSFQRLHTIPLHNWQGSVADSAYQDLVKHLEEKVGSPTSSLTLDGANSDVVASESIAATDREQEHLDVILSLAERGDLAGVYARLGISPPPYEKSLEIDDVDKLMSENYITSSRCLPPADFQRLLERLVALERERGGGARPLYLLMACGKREIATQMLKLLVSHIRTE